MDILNEAVRTYYVKPAEFDTIQSMRSQLYAVLSGTPFHTDATVITSDPGEESDDILMIRYILMRVSGGPLYVILSNGVLKSDERFAHLKHIFPEFQSAEFGVPFVSPSHNIIFLRDGEPFTYPVNCYINCGPCHSITLKSIFERLKESKLAGNNARMITVGANADGTFAGINQKQTDDGPLKDLHWNESLAILNSVDVTIKNLDVSVSRYVLLPHPSRIEGEYGAMPAECFDDIMYTTAMFFASRPSPKLGFALRVNQGNSIVVSQLIDVLAYQETRPVAFAYGLELISKYATECPTHQIAVSAAIPLMATALMGGVYKVGENGTIYGFSPTDKTARVNVSCLTPDSVREFLSNIRELEKFTPGYDLLAVILGKS